MLRVKLRNAVHGMSLLLLSFVLFMLVPFVSRAAAGDEEFEIGATYIVPMEFYGFSNARDWDAPELSGLYASKRLQIYDNALVERLSDGTYKVSVLYHGFHLPDMIQVMGEDGFETVKETYERPSYVPMSTYNAPDQYNSESGFEDVKKYISDEEKVKDYYRWDFTNMLYDEALDTGKIELILDSLSEKLIIRCCYTTTGYYSSSISSTQIKFDGSEAKRLTAYPEGTDQILGYEWYNYADVLTWSIFSRKYTDRDISMYEKIQLLFEQAVSVQVKTGGALHAEFVIDDPGEITSIAVAVRKEADLTKYTKNEATSALNECAKMDFQEIWNSSSGEDRITLDFDDIADTVYLRMTTKEIDAYNAGQSYEHLKRYWYGYLKLEPDVKDKAEDIKLQDGDAALNLKSDAVPEGTELSFKTVAPDDTPAYISKYTADGYRRFSDGGTSCVIYDSSLISGDTRVTELKGSATITVKLPDSFNMDTTAAMIKTSDGRAMLNGMNQYLNKENHTFVYTTTQATELNATYIFIDRGEVTTPAELEKLDAGVYHVDITVGHVLYPFRPSMANSSIINNEGYLVVTETNGEKHLELYYQIEPVLVSSIIGYMTGEYYCIGSDRSDYESVDILEYYAKEDGSLAYDDWAVKHDFQYLKRMSFPLSYPQEDGTYMIRFGVPAMDAELGDGSGIQYAGLRIRNPEKVSGNPLTGYDKSILRAMIDTAFRYRDGELTEGSAEYVTLGEAIEKAETVYDSNPDSDMVKAERDALKAVFENAGGGGDQDLADGTYELPFDVLNYRSEPSAFADYFDASKADMTVSNGTMTITLTAVKTGDGSDYVNYFLYDNGSGGTIETEAEIVEGQMACRSLTS